jgi:hypothetical protein
MAASGLALQKLRYDTEYESIHYSTAEPTDPVARLAGELEAGEVVLPFDAANGYLAPLLAELGIPVSSQILVFTKTSFQKGRISPRTPRAIYFSDDAYVAWVQDGPLLEISSVDPVLGAVFYTLRQEKEPRPALERQTFVCLQCHDSYSLTGGGVPRHIMGSGIPDPSGRLASHEGWYLTDDRTPIEKRWGGWYVTGNPGGEPHMGNVVAKDAAEAATLDFAATPAVTDLSRLLDIGPYLGKQSDVVALLVIEHQVHVQNLITRVGWDTRRALDEAEKRGEAIGDDRRAEIERLADPLLRAMLFADEAPLRGAVVGSSAFATVFADRGPFDERGRSLRQFDLKGRLFRYPVSYLIYSESFDALPEPTRRYVYRRLRDVLEGKAEGAELTHGSEADRDATLEILEATKPGFRRTSGEASLQRPAFQTRRSQSTASSK